MTFPFRDKPVSWWLSTPLYASRRLRRCVRVRREELLSLSARKRRVLRGVARSHGLCAFVETGTFKGETVEALLPIVNMVQTVELSPALYEDVRARFADRPQVKLWQGDSAALLPDMLEGLSEPVLFWLDGHYSGGETAKASLETPIEAELDAVFAWMRGDEARRLSVVLIDDARLFGQGDYPSRERLAAIARLQNFTCRESGDIFHLVAARP